MVLKSKSDHKVNQIKLIFYFNQFEGWFSLGHIRTFPSGLQRTSCRKAYLTVQPKKSVPVKSGPFRRRASQAAACRPETGPVPSRDPWSLLQIEIRTVLVGYGHFNWSAVTQLFMTEDGAKWTTRGRRLGLGGLHSRSCLWRQKYNFEKSHTQQ